MTIQTHMPAIVDVNLLPAEQRPAQVSGLALAIAAFLAILLLAAVPLAFRTNAAQERATDALQLAQGAEIELEAVEAELAQQRALRVETDQLVSQQELLESERMFLQGGARPLHEDLFWLYGLGFLPPGARITAVTATETGFSVDGTAAGALDGIAYAEKLASTGGFASARMVSFTPGDRTTGRFTVEVQR
jgi:hypothetical protein